MAQDPDLSGRLDAAMRQAYEYLRDTHGYPANRFLQMLNQHGGVETAKRLLRDHWRSQSDVVSGFLKLIEIDQVPLSVEVMVLRSEWEPLFTEADRSEALHRLRLTRQEGHIPS